MDGEIGVKFGALVLGALDIAAHKRKKNREELERAHVKPLSHPLPHCLLAVQGRIKPGKT